MAAATNFTGPLEVLIPLFEQDSGHRLLLSSGSTGQLYAQIRHGAPYTVFLAADAARPVRLEAEGKGLAGSRFTYAVGRLALWNPRAEIKDGAALLRQADFRHLALANPRLAPYGLAARQSLEALELWDALGGRIVLGENIGQAWALAATGNAELGLVALSQLKHPGAGAPGGWWLVPDSLHEPVRQQAILLRESPAGRAFLAFLQSDTARAVIAAHGYGLDGE